MPRIAYIDVNGEKQEVEAENGSTVMENAIRNGVVGIVAECGGAMNCGTCHVYVDEAWLPKVGEAKGAELDTLDFAFDVKPNSRLSCQIVMRDDLDGLIVRVADRQT
jgi:2Fe-2S ferredoxin